MYVRHRSQVVRYRLNLTTRVDETGTYYTAENKQTTMATAACQGNGGADHISDLCDDLLLHVLRFLSDDARDAVRTSALSTRWRDLLTRAPVLRLIQHKAGSATDEQFKNFVHNVFARRSYGGADIDRLELHAGLWPGKSRADVWFRLAMLHTVGSLEIELSMPPIMMGMTGAVSDQWPPRVDLPTNSRVTKMSLGLDGATLLLPPAVEFHALTDLTLDSIEFFDDDGPLLGHLLSSPWCCPRLRNLKLSALSGLDYLRLDGGALENLYLADLDVMRLDVDAPRLLEFHTAGSFFMHYYRHNEHTSLTVRAPSLEKLETSLEFGRRRVQDCTIELLQECRPAHGHTLCLSGPQKLTEGEEDDAMIGMPQLPGVKNLTIKYCSQNSHYLGATVSSVLARCRNLEYLHLDNQIHLQYGPRCDERCGDCKLRGSWKDSVILLAHLREVKLSGFSGHEYCCRDMVQLLLASAPALERMIIITKASIKGWWRHELVLFMNSLESSLSRGKGKWIACPAANAVSIEWSPNPQDTDDQSRRYVKLFNK